MKKPQYTHGFVDRHGKARFYFRRKGHKQIPLPGLPWSPEFMTAWDAAMKGDATPALTIGADQTKPGTVDALVAAYFASSQFLSLSLSTRATYRGIIERFRKENGQRRIAHLQRDKLREMLGNWVRTPAAANNWLSEWVDSTCGTTSFPFDSRRRARSWRSRSCLNCARRSMQRLLKT